MCSPQNSLYSMEGGSLWYKLRIIKTYEFCFAVLSYYLAWYREYRNQLIYILKQNEYLTYNFQILVKIPIYYIIGMVGKRLTLGLGLFP